MPISADPNDTVCFTLAVDKDKSVTPFKLRFLTVRQRLAVDKLIREAGAEETDDAKANDKLSEVIKIGVVNLDGDLDDVLTIYEKWELAYAVQSRTAMEELDRKKLISLSGTSTQGAEPKSEQNSTPS